MAGTQAEHTILILYQKHSITDDTHGTGLDRKCAFTDSTGGFIVILCNLLSFTEKIRRC